MREREMPMAMTGGHLLVGLGREMVARAACLLAACCLLAPLSAGGFRVAAAEEPADAAAERRRRVVEFVREHQPELAGVLEHLEQKKPADHARAIEELDRSVRLLVSGKARDPRLHELEIECWKTRMRVDLLGARLLAAKGSRKATAEREELERQLRAAITAELDARAAQLAYRKERSIAWYDRQIERLTSKREELVAARLAPLLGEASDGRR
jgi:hypothetical protein